MRWIIIALCCIVLFPGCNLYGTTDSPNQTREKKNAAIVDGNKGSCGTARNILIGIPSPDDEVLAALGWAQICLAGATSVSIANTVYKFTSSSSDLTVVGSLSRTMLPMTNAKLGETLNAIGVFNNIRDIRTQNLQVAIARIVRAAAIIANQAIGGANAAKLEQDDIAPAACTAVDSACAGAGGVCTAGMSDADVTDVITLISDAANNLNTAGAGDLRALTTSILSGLGAGGDTGRCFIYKRLIPNP